MDATRIMYRRHVPVWLYVRPFLCVVSVDLSLEDSGNYTCEVRGPRANTLGDVTHYIFIRGM